MRNPCVAFMVLAPSYSGIANGAAYRQLHNDNEQLTVVELPPDDRQFPNMVVTAGAAKLHKPGRDTHSSGLHCPSFSQPRPTPHGDTIGRWHNNSLKAATAHACFPCRRLFGLGESPQGLKDTSNVPAALHKPQRLHRDNHVHMICSSRAVLEARLVPQPLAQRPAAKSRPGRVLWVLLSNHHLCACTEPGGNTLESRVQSS